MKSTRFIAVVLVLILVSIPVLAHEAHAMPAPEKGFRAEMLAQSASIEKKLVDLAEAVPADKFDWRPAEGVRSVGEVYAHVAVGNYFLMSFLGVKLPEGIDLKTMEGSLKGKEKTLAAMKESFRFANAEIVKMSDADLEKAVTFFGKTTTARGLLMIEVEHISEHLGQSIAYARMNGITPPWSKKGE